MYSISSLEQISSLSDPSGTHLRTTAANSYKTCHYESNHCYLC